MTNPDWVPARVGRYEEWTLGELGLYYESYNAILDRVVESAAVGPGSRVLDIGCGTGELSRRVAATGARVLGVDPSEAMLGRAEERVRSDGPGEMAFILADSPFLRPLCHSGGFGAVVSTYAFHHVEPDDKRAAVREMVRVLGPGGRIVIGDNMFATREALATALERWSHELEEEHFGIIEELGPMFLEAGLSFKAEQMARITWVVTGRLALLERD